MAIRKRNIEDVRLAFEERGYELLDSVYVDNKTPLRYRCKKHPNLELKICFNSLSSSSSGCFLCVGRNRWTISQVKTEFTKRGYLLLETSYRNNKTPMRYQCPFHFSESLTINLNNLLSGYGCPHCAYEGNIGEGNPNWQGGVSDLNQFLRPKVWKWKEQSRKSTDGECWISGSNCDIHIHHTEPYHKIRDEAIYKSGLTVRKNIGEYAAIELTRLVREFRSLHSKVVGIPIRKDLHELFHKEYGFDTTMADLYEFKAKYLSGHYDNLIRRVS